MKQSTAEQSRINRVLGIYGLPPMGAPGFCEAIAGLIGIVGQKLGGAEDLFRSLLMKCEPEERRHMYEALRPHLPFQAKPLDVYMSECGDLAERKQLPTITADGGLAPFRVPEVSSDPGRCCENGYFHDGHDCMKSPGVNLDALQEAIGVQLSKGSLELVCRKCTREAQFYGKNKAEAIHYARIAGWTYGLDPAGHGREICPLCPTGTPDAKGIMNDDYPAN